MTNDGSESRWVKPHEELRCARTLIWRWTTSIQLRPEFCQVHLGDGFNRRFGTSSRHPITRTLSSIVTNRFAALLLLVAVLCASASLVQSAQTQSVQGTLSGSVT